jgi:hypothetical protein
VLRRRPALGRNASEEREWWIWWPSRRASSFAGLLLRAASSVVRPWGRVKVRFRRKMPRRWRSLRFCASSRGRVDSDIVSFRDRTKGRGNHGGPVWAGRVGDNGRW